MNLLALIFFFFFLLILVVVDELMISHVHFLWPCWLYSLLVSSVHGIFQAKTLEWIAISFSRGSSRPRDWTQVSYISGDSLPAETPGKPLVPYVSMKPPYVSMKRSLEYDFCCICHEQYSLGKYTWTFLHTIAHCEEQRYVIAKKRF